MDAFQSPNFCIKLYEVYGYQIDGQTDEPQKLFKSLVSAYFPHLTKQFRFDWFVTFAKNHQRFIETQPNYFFLLILATDLRPIV